MTEINQDFTMYPGEDKIITITIPGVNLTGAQSIEWVLNLRTPLSKTVGSGIVVTDPTNGILQITLDSADTELVVGAFEHECRIKDVSGLESVVTTGLANIKKSTTVTV